MLPVALLSGSSDAGACTINGQVADCPLGSLAPDTLRNVTFRVQGTSAGSLLTTLRVISTNDALPTNDARTLRLTFAPGADLAAGVTLDSGSITAGGTVNATITLDNRGPAAATDARLVITLPANLTVQSQTLEGLTCVPVTDGLTCGPQALAAGATARVNLVLRGDISGSFNLGAVASSSAPEIQPNDNTVQRTLQVNAVPVPNPGTGGGSGGGGGGSLSAGLLALLSVMSASDRAGAASGRRGSRGEILRQVSLEGAPVCAASMAACLQRFARLVPRIRPCRPSVAARPATGNSRDAAATCAAPCRRSSRRWWCSSRSSRAEGVRATSLHLFLLRAQRRGIGPRRVALVEQLADAGHGIEDLRAPSWPAAACRPSRARFRPGSRPRRDTFR